MVRNTLSMEQLKIKNEISILEKEISEVLKSSPNEKNPSHVLEKDFEEKIKEMEVYFILFIIIGYYILKIIIKDQIDKLHISSQELVAKLKESQNTNEKLNEKIATLEEEIKSLKENCKTIETSVYIFIYL